MIGSQRAPSGSGQSVQDRLNGADIVPLTMSLVHLTGDLSLLSEIAPFVRGPWDYRERVPGPLKATIHARLAAELARIAAGGKPLLPMPSLETMRGMMSVAVGKEVSEEYVPMLLEQMALDPAEAEPAWRADLTRAELPDFHVAVIGAGPSGLCAALQLQQAGIPFTVFEKNEELGGTWYENRYPGCAVDTPNHFYQYSFIPNNDWPDYFSRQPSILAYLADCADAHGLRRHIRFGREVRSAVYDEGGQFWTITACGSDGREERLVANVVICAVGQLNRPAIPALPGLENFAGEAIHTSAWHDQVSVAGKHVALVGTGASAVQVGPGIVDAVARLTVYQRSGSWIVNNPNIHRSVGDDKKWALRHVPYYAAWYRFQLFWGFGDGLFEALKIDPHWPGGSHSINAVNDRYRQAMLRHMHQELDGRDDLIAKATPDYPPYGKRVLADAGWFRMLRREHVELVTEPIERIEPEAIRLRDGRAIRTDTIIFATGFQAGRMLWPMDIRGRGGRTIRDRWEDSDPRAYLGITVPEFPNLMLLFGPNTNLGHGGSAIFLAECQVHYCMKLLQTMIEGGCGELECREDAHDRYNAQIDRELKHLVWSHPSVSTWYKNAQGRVITNQPWRLVEYWRLTREPKLADYNCGRGAAGCLSREAGAVSSSRPSQ